jgi:hypothetical protein
MPETIRYPHIDANGDLKIEWIKFNNSGKHYILKMNISNLENDNYRLCLDGSRLSVIISEPLDYSRPIHLHNINWKMFTHQTFDLLKQADIWLPGDNFYLIRHLALPDDNILEVILGNK